MHIVNHMKNMHHEEHVGQLIPTLIQDYFTLTFATVLGPLGIQFREYVNVLESAN